MCALLALIALLGLCLGVRAAEVTTDQSDYAPGSTANITGTGFAAGETIRLQVLHADGTPATGDDHQPWNVVADASGGLATTWHVCTDDCRGSTLRLTAAGQASALTAEAFFTDAVFGISGGPPILQPPGSGGCARQIFVPGTPPTPPSRLHVVRPGYAYLFRFILVTNGAAPSCFAANPSSIPSITFSLGPNYGNLTFTAVGQPSGIYTNTVTIPANACGTTPIFFTCDNGSVGRVRFGGLEGQLVASPDCLSSTACSGQQPVTIACPNNLSVNTDPGQCSAVVNYAVPAATGFPTPTVTCTPPPGFPFQLGTTTVNCTAVNNNGFASCSFTVTVLNKQAPTLTCHDMCLAADLGFASCSASSYRLDYPTFTGNCPLVSLTSDAPSSLPLGVTTVTWVARDSSGNTAQCRQTVTVVSWVSVNWLPPLAGQPVGNKIRVGQVVPHKVELKDCHGNLVTSGVTVKLKVRGIEIGGSVFQDIIEIANGTGTDGVALNDGIMILRDSHWHFNLDTGNFSDLNTVGSERFYQSTVTVIDNATGCEVGSRSITLETRR